MTDFDNRFDWGDPYNTLWQAAFLSRLEENLSKCQWEDKEGKVIKFRQMETSHIKNCINYIQRKGLHIEFATFSDYIGAFNDELERRNEESEKLRKCLTSKNPNKTA